MNKIDIEKSIAALCNQNKIQISELPRFTFGTKEQCTHLIGSPVKTCGIKLYIKHYCIVFSTLAL